MTDVKLVIDINVYDNAFNKPWNTSNYKVNDLLFMRDI